MFRRALEELGLRFQRLVGGAPDSEDPPSGVPSQPIDPSRGGHSEFSARWLSSAPNRHLTWGRTITGDAFVIRAARLGAFGRDKRILEIGPGYGRILSSVLKFGLPFGEYLGLDISPQNVQFLKQKFPDARMDFIVADVESVQLGHQFDTLLSSLTLKHLYPTFEQALRNLRPFVREGGAVVFDLMERFTSWPATMVRWQVATVAPDDLEHRGKTFVRSYTRAEVGEILQRSGYRLESLSHVAHTLTRVRLLVVARPAPSGESS